VVAANWKPFIFQGRAHEILKEAARVLEKTEVHPDTRIHGRIVQLKSDFPPGKGEQGEFEHIITVVWEREKAQSLKVRVPLNPEEYRNACDAHKDGKQFHDVLYSSTLRRVGLATLRAHQAVRIDTVTEM